MGQGASILNGSHEQKTHESPAVVASKLTVVETKQALALPVGSVGPKKFGVRFDPDTGVALKEPTSPTGGLAARRKMRDGLALQVTTKREGPITKGDSVQKIEKRKITVCSRFADFYKIGAEVMPSTNTGMEVRHAKRVSDNLDVVIKVRTKGNSFVSKDDEQEWRRSTDMLLNLPVSENIAQIYDAMEDSHAYYIVMEKADGMDLFEVLHSEGRIPLGEAKAILRQLIQAVEDLHARGCIHKDLKLENIMVDSPKVGSKSGNKSPKHKHAPKCDSPKHGRGAAQEPPSPTSPVVKLIDFDTVETFSPKNLAKSVVGTDQYIAPEAYTGHYSPASDVFSVGVIAYRLICGKFPFKNAMFDDEPGENWVGSPKMKEIQNRLKHFHINFEHPPWPTEPKARELARWMLQNNEKDRPTAKQALEHPFFEVTGRTPALPKNPWAPRTLPPPK